MNKLRYLSSVEEVDLVENGTFRPISPSALLCYEGEPVQILLNGILHSVTDGEYLECNDDVDITLISENGNKQQFYIRPRTNMLPQKLASPYEDFYHEYEEVDKKELLLYVLEHQLRLFAMPNPEIQDCSALLSLIESVLPYLRNICSRPRSHLKSINEIRPIETVKRIGHESIPYLASHSEDWLARTASGLKPSRLYSRVEEDDFHIYENRVIKTIIDDAILYLRRKYRELGLQYEQLTEIINSSVQADSFGFDQSHQISVYELLGRSSDMTSDYVQDSKNKKQIGDQLHRIKKCLHSYEELRVSRLYKKMKKARRVYGNLKQTNILLMDKHYHGASLLWKPLEAALQKEDSDMREWQTENHLSRIDIMKSYKHYCETIAAFSLHTLGFEPSADDSAKYLRPTDELCVLVSEMKGNILVSFSENKKHSIPVGVEVQSPISVGEHRGAFSFDGKSILWSQNLSQNDIETFSALHKTKQSRGAEQAQEKRKSVALYQAIDAEQRKYKIRSENLVLIPMVCDISDSTQNEFVRNMSVTAENIRTQAKADLAIVLMPLCDKNQQVITNYAYYFDEKVAFLPVSMYDINSYRRLRNLFLRYITLFSNNHCPCCGNETIPHGYGRLCRNCGNLYVREVVCSDQNCRHKYTYLWYDASLETIENMVKVDSEQFFRIDSLYQYKNIVPMSIHDGKIVAQCPWHHTANEQSEYSASD